jgi:exonuclease III
VCIYVKNGQHFIKIDTLRYCKEQKLEICAMQLETKSANLIILSLYKAPSGDTDKFLKRLDTILKSLYSPKSEFITYGDININHLNENDRKQ